MLPITHAGARPLLGWAIAHLTLDVMMFATKANNLPTPVL
jgi:hypothetical protein